MGALCVYEIPLLINMSNRGVEHPWSVEQGAEARGSPVSHRIPRKLHLPWVLITGKVSHPSMSSFLLQFFDVCCAEARYVWWSFHPVDSIIGSLYLYYLLYFIFNEDTFG